jgi:hypothetical protein
VQSTVDYYFRFHNITVPSADGTADLATSISVDRYRLGAGQAFIDERFRVGKKIERDLRIRRQSDPNDNIKVWVSTVAGYEEREFSSFGTIGNDPLWALIRYPYVGKGSPEAIQVALQLAAVDLPDSPAIVTPDDFQSYCDKWFGLDCNGFVGNYLRHEYLSIPWWDTNTTKGEIEPNNLISDIWNKFPGTVRNSSAEIDYSDLNLLVMVDQSGKIIPGGSGPFGHIAISGPGDGATIDGLKEKVPGAGDDGIPAICVVESTGAIEAADGKTGLARSYYAYVDHPQLPGVFRMHRGLNGSLINVRVKGLAWPQ